MQQRKDFDAAIARQQKQTETLVARLIEQEIQIQKLNAQVETSSPCPTNPGRKSLNPVLKNPTLSYQSAKRSVRVQQDFVQWGA